MRKMTITPEIAREMLKKNTNNRPLSKRTLSRYVQLMKNGEWGITTDAIGFDVNGRLINGQHRLNAVVESGTEQEFYVVEDMPGDSFCHIDEGRNRTASDILFIARGVKRCAALAAIVRSHMALENKHYERSSDSFRPSNEAILVEYDKHSEIYNDICLLADKYYCKLNILTRAEIGSIFAFVVISKNHEFSLAEAFFDELFYGSRNDRNIGLLRDRLIKDKIKNYSIKYTSKISLIAKTWNTFLTGKRYITLKHQKNEGLIEFR